MSADRTSRAADFERLVVTHDNVVVVWRQRVLVQIRRGPLDPAVLRRSHAYAEPLMARGTAIALLAVLEPGAPLPSAELRKMQRELIELWAANERVRVAAAMLGEDTTASLVRSSGRLLARANPRVERFDAVRPAVSWLAQELSSMGERVSSVDLYEAAEAVRKLGAAET